MSVVEATKVDVVLGMRFREDEEPDFGSIERGAPDELTLLDADKGKLNSALTNAVCTPKLAAGEKFNIPSGCFAIIADVPAVWIYHAKSDHWYELADIENW